MSANLKLELDHSIRIRKPASKIFEAISSPEHLNRYFTSKAVGHLRAGEKISWQWSDHPIDVPITVVENNPPTRLVFQWPTHNKKYMTTVQFDLEDQGEKGTIVRVREGAWEADADGMSNSYENSGGWMHMLCCLKAYLDFDLDLRSKPLPENWVK